MHGIADAGECATILPATVHAVISQFYVRFRVPYTIFYVLSVRLFISVSLCVSYMYVDRF